MDKPDLTFSLMSEEYVKERYKKTKQAVGYYDLKRVIGVWDDHDYGSNDAGSEMTDKHRNRGLFLDFIGEPSDSERRL